MQKNISREGSELIIDGAVCISATALLSYSDNACRWKVR
jgi:hypothetical protein